MKRKKVLIITYYWPPSGGAGVQRWLKFAKYLPEYGWDPIIYTPVNPEAPVEDPSLLNDVPESVTVIKTPIWEPYRFYKKFVGEQHSKIKHGFLSPKKKPTLRQKISVWIRGNLFIPDARKFWIRPSIRYLKKYLKEKPVDILVSTGPPHSMHLIAMDIHEVFKIPWVADFRDPWTNIDYYQNLRLTSYADKRHHKFERKVLTTATQILTIGWTLAEELKSIGAKKIDVITNGFDRHDFTQKNLVPTKHLIMTHIGAMNSDRNPNVFWRTLERLKQSHAELIQNVKIQLIGDNDFSVYESINRHGLQNLVEFSDYIHHKTVINRLYQSHILLLALNNTPNQKGILPGKLFEYLASNRFILAIGPEDGDTARILDDTKAGVIVGFNNDEKLYKILLHLFDNPPKIPILPENQRVDKYDRKTLAFQLCGLFNTLISEK